MRQPCRATAAVLLPMLPVVAGCGDAAPDAALVRDSAGVRIVENAVEPRDLPPPLRLSETPLLDIGVVEGAPEYQLDRVDGAARLSDGRIVIANRGSGELRVYGPDGEFLLAAGRPGEGPGEFRQLRAVWPYRGDSILAWDDRLGRASVFAGDGSFGRGVLLYDGGSRAILDGSFADGGLLVESRETHGSDQPLGEPRSVELTLHRYAPDGQPEDSLGQWPAYTVLPIPLDEESIAMSGEVFADRTHVVPLGASVVVGTTRGYEVEVLEPGEPPLRIRWPGPDRTVTEGHRERYREHRLESVRRRLGEVPPWERRILDAAVYAPERAAYASILGDAAGRIWIEAFRWPWEAAEPARWLVLERDGRVLGEVSTPPGAEILHVGKDHVLTLERDELDVEHVRMYGLEDATGDRSAGARRP